MLEPRCTERRRSLRGSPEEGEPIAVVNFEAAPVEGAAGKWLLCARCRHRVTPCDARLHIQDRDQWERTNPGGWTYRFACFSTAPGCVSQGVPSKQATWFAGYHWHAQGCGGCGEHLGWLFFTGDHAFHALVLDRLIDE